jgi:hypothetical protein
VEDLPCRSLSNVYNMYIVVNIIKNSRHGLLAYSAYSRDTHDGDVQLPLRTN